MAMRFLDYAHKQPLILSLKPITRLFFEKFSLVGGYFGIVGIIPLEANSLHNLISLSCSSVSFFVMIVPIRLN